MFTIKVIYDIKAQEYRGTEGMTKDDADKYQEDGEPKWEERTTLFHADSVSVRKKTDGYFYLTLTNGEHSHDWHPSDTYECYGSDSQPWQIRYSGKCRNVYIENKNGKTTEVLRNPFGFFTYGQPSHFQINSQTAQ